MSGMSVVAANDPAPAPPAAPAPSRTCRYTRQSRGRKAWACPGHCLVHVTSASVCTPQRNVSGGATSAKNTQKPNVSAALYVPFRSDNAGSRPVTPPTPGRGPGRNRECLADEPWRRGAARGRRTSAAPRALRFLIQMLYDYAPRWPGHPKTDEATSKTRRLPFKKFMLTLCYTLSALEIKRRTMAGSFPALRGKPKW